MVRGFFKISKKALAHDDSQVDILRSDAGIRRLPFSASGRRHQSHYPRRQHPSKAARAILSVMDFCDESPTVAEICPKDGYSGMGSTTKENLVWISCS